MANKVILEFVGEGNRLVGELTTVDNAIDKTTKKTTRGTQVMRGAFERVGHTITDTAVSALKGMFEEAREAEKVSRSTAQGIKTMGAEAWTSAEAVGALAESISNKIGVDDEAIQQSANLLLTFGNVRNEVGKLNNVFDRAVIASQDLAAKGFGDADSAAKMLGKALNDPIKGMTALGKAGVTFSEDQKKAIKSMVESGDLLGAQKMLLEEVEKQVGGTAEATATSTDKMAVRWANFQEQLGTEMMPILEKLLEHLSKFIDWASEHQEIVTAFAAITASIWLLNAAMNANPVILIISLLFALVAAIIYLWNTNEGFRNAIIGAWAIIKSSVETAVNRIVGFWNTMWRIGSDVVTGIVNAWNAVVSFFRNLPGWIETAISTVWNIITWPFRKAWEIISGIFKKIMNAVGDMIAGIKEAVSAMTGLNMGGRKTSFKGGKFGKFHTGGRVPGMVGTEQLAVLKAGEHVSVRGQGGGGTTINFGGNTDGAFASAFQKLVRDRVITIGAA